MADKNTLAVVSTLVVYGGAGALLFWVSRAAVAEPGRYGGILLGSVVGWTLYYFVRKYSVFSPKMLAATLSAVVGGEALAWIAQLRASEIKGLDTQYFVGL